ncbi:MAG: hypothetical protein WC552_04565 [Candidatus Omnitrophota bacterium]
MLNREVLAEKIKDFLENNISQESLYEWALAQAVREEYDELAKNDPVVKKTMQALIDINQEDVQHKPTREDLKFYRRCLEGRDVLEADGEEGRGKGEEFKRDRLLQRKEEFYFISRVYVILFASCSAFVNFYSIIYPGFIKFALAAPSRWVAFQQAFPHFLYAVFLIMPPRILAGRKLFLPSFVVLAMGTLYYWMVAVAIVEKLSLHVLLLAAIAPFSATPALLALMLLWEAKKGGKDLTK